MSQGQGITPRSLRPWVLVAMLAGVALALGVAAWIGLPRVLAALAAIGWRGLGGLIAWSVIPFALLGEAWFILLPGRPAGDLGRLIAARVVRDSAGELLPFTQIGGFAAGVRAAVLQGLAPQTAVASTVVDVTAELIAQLGFTGLGLAMLATRLGASAGSASRSILDAGLAGLALTALAAGGFVAFQRRGGPILAAIAGRIAPAASGGVEATSDAVNALYRSPARLIGAVACHLGAWVASAVGVWLALRIGGSTIGLSDMLAIEGLIAAVRSAAFVAPMAAGVQEASYALIGPLFGLPADMALGVSLIKRGRDLAIGLPALAVWQTAEARRLLRRTGR